MTKGQRCKDCDCFYDVRLGEHFISKYKLSKYKINKLKKGGYCVKRQQPVQRNDICNQFEIYVASNEKEFAYALRCKMEHIQIKGDLYQHLISLFSYMSPILCVTKNNANLLRNIFQKEEWKHVYKYAPCFVNHEHSLSTYYHKQVEELQLPYNDEKLKQAMQLLLIDLKQPNCIYSLAATAYYAGTIDIFKQITQYSSFIYGENTIYLQKIY